MRPYLALIHRAAGSGFGVSFPDFPGCVTAGATLDEARDRAAEALGFHMEAILLSGGALPEPSSLEAAMGEGDDRDGVAVFVSATVLAAKKIRFDVTLPADLLDEVDRHAEAGGLTRSGFLERAAKRAMALNPPT